MKPLGPDEGMNALRHPDCRFCDEYQRLLRGPTEEVRQLKARVQELGKNAGASEKCRCTEKVQVQHAAEHQPKGCGGSGVIPCATSNPGGTAPRSGQSCPGCPECPVGEKSDERLILSDEGVAGLLDPETYQAENRRTASMKRRLRDACEDFTGRAVELILRPAPAEDVDR